MPHRRKPLVAGERAGDIAKALLRLRMTQRPDGWYDGHGLVPADEVAPFRAALMRTEATLLLEDADVVSAGGDEPRTVDQRRADALVALTLQVGQALRGS